ncbi:hypothetical protein PG987_004284 [Apiospora arundinis]
MGVTGSPELTTTTDGDEVSVPSVSEVSQASLPSQESLSLEQRRTLEWVRQGSRDDSSYTFDYAQDGHRLEAAVPDRPQSEGSEPREIEVDETSEVENIVDIQHTNNDDQFGLPVDDTTEESVDQEEVVDQEEEVGIQHTDTDVERQLSTETVLPVAETIEVLKGTTTEERQDDEIESSDSEEEEIRPESIERPTTSLSFRDEDERGDYDDDREVATTSLMVDITQEYELPQSDEDVIAEEEEEVEAAADDTPDEEAAEESVEVIPDQERITEERPRLLHQHNLSPERRAELTDLKSKLVLLQLLRERETNHESLEVESSPASASSSTITAEQRQDEAMNDDNSIFNEQPELSPERHAELVDLRTKLRLFMEMREREHAAENALVQPSIPETILEEEEELEEKPVEEQPEQEPVEEEASVEVEEEAAETSESSESEPQTPESTDLDLETVDNDDDYETMKFPPPPLEESEEPLWPEPEEEEETQTNEDDGLIDPFSERATEALDFIKAWLLLPDELSALEVLYQLASLRDSLTFIPGWVPTKHQMVRQDEVLTLSSEQLDHQINWHYIQHLRSLRWHDLLSTSGSSNVDAADRAWLAGFLDEMMAPTFIFGRRRPPRKPKGPGRPRRSQSLGPAPSSAATPGGGQAKPRLRRRNTLLHQVEAAEALLPHEEKLVQAMNQFLWTRHAQEAAGAVVRDIYHNTAERVAWIDAQADMVRGELEDMDQSLQSLLDTVASFESVVYATAEAHEQDHADLAKRLQQSMLV